MQFFYRREQGTIRNFVLLRRTQILHHRFKLGNFALRLHHKRTHNPEDYWEEKIDITEGTLAGHREGFFLFFPPSL